MDTYDTYHFHAGHVPMLVSIPHAGTRVPDAIHNILTPAARHLPDTDWYVNRLYSFLPSLGVSVIQANFSRYVVDLNRSVSGQSLYPGQTVTDVCPMQMFSGDAVYLPGCEPTQDQMDERIDRYWKPYHQKIQQELERIQHQAGYAILWDAHSIKSEWPLLFDGALPDFNWGTYAGKSCAASLSDVLLRTVRDKNQYSAVLNGRFKGGYITRHYGNPSRAVHAVQLELSQSTYMNEQVQQRVDNNKAATLKVLLTSLINTALAWHPDS